MLASISMSKVLHNKMKLSLTCFLCCFVFIPKCSLCIKSREVWNWNSDDIKDRDNGYLHIVHGVEYREDPEVLMNVTQLITSKGYPCEEYDVHTVDGYILGVQRIPHDRVPRRRYRSPRPVVLLQHGLLSSAADWVENPVNESLGFLLADAGFDVWLGNSRGNTYSRRHTTLSPDDDRFWAFSWDEMAAYDLPATVDKVLEVTGASSLVYIGFSQGTQIAFAQLSHDKQLAKKVKLFIALGPIAYIKHIKGPLKLLAPFAKEVAFLYTLFGGKDFLPNNYIMKYIAEDICTKEIPSFVCENIIFLLGGYDYNQMNRSRIPVYIAHTPAGTSVKNVIHYAQSVQSGEFQRFDYGARENQKRYNQTTPPHYQPKHIDVPIALFSGTSDRLADPRDLERLVPQLKRVVFHKVIPSFEHLDLIWGIDANTVCYDDVIELAKAFNNIA